MMYLTQLPPFQRQRHRVGSNGIVPPQAQASLLPSSYAAPALGASRSSAFASNGELDQNHQGMMVMKTSPYHPVHHNTSRQASPATVKVPVPFDGRSVELPSNTPNVVAIGREDTAARDTAAMADDTRGKNVFHSTDSFEGSSRCLPCEPKLPRLPKQAATTKCPFDQARNADSPSTTAPSKSHGRRSPDGVDRPPTPQNLRTNPERQAKVKTEMCKYFEEGLTCPWGVHCEYFSLLRSGIQSE